MAKFDTTKQNVKYKKDMIKAHPGLDKFVSDKRVVWKSNSQIDKYNGIWIEIWRRDNPLYGWVPAHIFYEQAEYLITGHSEIGWLFKKNKIHELMEKKEVKTLSNKTSKGFYMSIKELDNECLGKYLHT